MLDLVTWKLFVLINEKVSICGRHKDYPMPMLHQRSRVCKCDMRIYISGSLGDDSAPISVARTDDGFNRREDHRSSKKATLTAQEVSFYLALSTYIHVKHRSNESTRMCHSTDEHIDACLPHVHSHRTPHPTHTCDPARVVQYTSHMHTHAMCATTITLIFSSTSCTIGCMCTIHTYLHRHM